MPLVPSPRSQSTPADDPAGWNRAAPRNHPTIPHPSPSPPGSSRLNSCLYECTVTHRRVSPKHHAFKHGLFLLSLDLDEWEAVTRRVRILGWNRPNLYSFHERDHLQMPGATGLKDSLTRWLASQGQPLPPNSRIQLVTLPRVLGYVFNPVSFYFCQDATGAAVCAVAEVGNTFGELKPFLVPHSTTSSEGGPLTHRFRRVVPKEFYVSPFTGLQVCFDFQLATPGDRLALRVNDVADGQPLLYSALAGRRRELTESELIRLTARYPLVTLRVITLIHWHALRLWWKRVPWHAKSADPTRQQGVFRPHRTLLSTVHPSPMPSPMPSPTPIASQPPKPL